MTAIQHFIAVASFDEWRISARMLIAQDVPPALVRWLNGSSDVDLFFKAQDGHEKAGLADIGTGGGQKESASLRVSRNLMEMLRRASCFRAPDRWAFLYQVLWRWQQGEKDVVSAADKDGNRLHAMVKAVRREEHDMHAYVRFRERFEQEGPPRFVAWYEPAHDVLAQVAKHFADRMGNTTWMIATPDASVLWDGETLHCTGPLTEEAAAAADSGEALWLTYYRSIFNPARLNTRVMQSHIPSRFWKNLPEGKLVPAMVAQASSGARSVGQAQSVIKRAGAVIPIEPQQAQPHRSMPTVLEQCRRCELWSSATQAVEGVGPSNAQIMLVGEQPGDQEDLEGRPFIGPAGQLLDQVLQEAGLNRESIYLTNAVKHFKWEPRGKRRLHKTPAQTEINACRYWLHEEIARVKPRVIVALGGTALKSLLGNNSVNLSDLLGKPFLHDEYWIIATYHPAYALRVPDEGSRRNALRTMAKAFRQAQETTRGTSIAGD
jgi:DNA polymerase